MTNVWPLPKLGNGIEPKISDGFHTAKDMAEGKASRIHPGVDLMYPATINDPSYTGVSTRSDYYKLGSIRRTRGHYVPLDTPAIACVDGKIFRVREGRKGKSVLLGTIGSKYVYYYQHLETVLVKLGQEVNRGEPIGIIGANPNQENGIVHLHFEVWESWDGKLMPPSNPEPFLKDWPKVFL